MKLICLDTESTGLPITPSFGRYYNPKETRYYDRSRVLTIAWIIYEDDKLVKSEHHLIKGDFDISEKSISIHGITKEKSDTEGKPIDDALTILQEDLEGCQRFIGYNLDFDVHILLAELNRLKGWQDLNDLLITIPKWDVMKKAYLGKKWLKLTKLYELLFDEVENNAHDALVDVRMTMRVYFDLLDNDGEAIVEWV
jgi:DNA polymerase-3 subunit alpha